MCVPSKLPNVASDPGLFLVFLWKLLADLQKPLAGFSLHYALKKARGRASQAIVWVVVGGDFLRLRSPSPNERAVHSCGQPFLKGWPVAMRNKAAVPLVPL